MSTTSIIKPIKMQQIEQTYGRQFCDIDDSFLRQGWSDSQIAEELDISVNTLKSYRALLGVERVGCLVSAR